MPESELHRDGTTDVRRGYEISDLNPRFIALFGIGLIITIALAVVVTSFFIRFRASQHAGHETPIPRLARERETTPEPRLQVDAAKELREMRAAEDAALGSYGWVDRDAGIVKIPIDRAMEILAKKGLPARQPERKER
jgi:hypothetical protein